MHNPVIGTVTSEWNPVRKHPVTGNVTVHAGIDIAAKEGTTIRAAFGGKVINVRNDSYPGDPVAHKGRTGNFVEIENPDGETQYYGHCKSVLVSVGQRVSAGDAIATVGKTGVVTGAHLHFETRDKKGRHKNPRTWFNYHKITPGKDSAPKPEKKYHTVKAGDVASRIAVNNNISLNKMSLLNPSIRDLGKIYPGQKLRVK